MISTDLILDAVNTRLQFWREQQQAAFRSGDAAGAAMCARILEEYAQLTAEAAGRVCRPAASESFIKGLTDAALV
jgi:hypothetical protein